MLSVFPLTINNPQIVCEYLANKNSIVLHIFATTSLPRVWVKHWSIIFEYKKNEHTDLYEYNVLLILSRVTESKDTESCGNTEGLIVQNYMFLHYKIINDMSRIYTIVLDITYMS